MKKFFVSTGRFLYDISDFNGPFIKNIVNRYTKTTNFFEDVVLKLLKQIWIVVMILSLLLIGLGMLYPILKFISIVVVAFN